MGKKKTLAKEEGEEKSKNWREGELIKAFQLNPIRSRHTLAMQEWLAVSPPVFDNVEQTNFDRYLFISTNRDDLLQIIAILRKFREILETRLMMD
jgi:hypothetical protein